MVKTPISFQRNDFCSNCFEQQRKNNIWKLSSGAELSRTWSGAPSGTILKTPRKWANSLLNEKDEHLAILGVYEYLASLVLPVDVYWSAMMN